MTSSNGDNNSADHWFKEGLRLGRLDDNDSAIKAYQKAVELDPELCSRYVVYAGQVPAGHLAQDPRKSRQRNPGQAS